MATIHFLNVKEGDCSIIQHDSNRITVIDVCNASIPQPPGVEQSRDRLIQALTEQELAARGNFGQKHRPVNPIEYMENHNIREVFRYIQTHPDMDHMDGIESLFARFSPQNFWDTNNKKEMPDWTGSPYRKSDWDFYLDLREGRRGNPPNRLALFAGSTGVYWNREENNAEGGDRIQILAPTPELVNQANQDDDEYNDCSYVILFESAGMKAIFAGDSHDNTWEHILRNHENAVRDTDLLMAPHHGRASGRKYDFLDVVNPTLTLFGNARHQFLAYDAWNNRKLWHVTNNQAGSMVIKADTYPWALYVTNEKYARSVNPSTFYDQNLQAWAVRYIQRA